MRHPAKYYHDHSFDDLLSQISFPPKQPRRDKIFHVRIFPGSPSANRPGRSQHPPAQLPLPCPVPCLTASWPWGVPPGITGKERSSTTMEAVFQHNKQRSEKKGKKQGE